MKRILIILIVATLTTIGLIFSGFKTKKDDRKISIKTYQDTYISIDLSRKMQLIADKKEISDLEIFMLIDIGNNKINLVAQNGKFVSLNPNDGKLYARAVIADELETFTLIDMPEGLKAIQASNGKYLTTDIKDAFQILANQSTIRAWESFTIIDR